jgi:hypothetical protein
MMGKKCGFAFVESVGKLLIAKISFKRLEEFLIIRKGKPLGHHPTAIRQTLMTEELIASGFAGRTAFNFLPL